MMTCELALAAVLLASGQAEPPALVGQAKTGATLLGVAVGETNRPPIDEQIEVMRALLVRKLGGRAVGAQPLAVFGDPIANRYTATIDPSASQPYPPGPVHGYGMAGYGGMVAAAGAAVEGAYLDGYGAVFTATLPATGRDPRPGAVSTKAPPTMTEWDRIQRQLRGESVPEQSADPPKEVSIGDIVLRALADNGKHLTALKDDEKVTVAVVFRGPHAARAATAYTGTTAAPGMMGNAAQGGYLGTYTFSTAEQQKGRDEELLGDLHLKQGQPQTAIEAFTKAITQMEHGGDNARLPDLYAKLAQAQTAAGKLDEARTALEKALELRRKANTAGANPIRPPAKAATPLPARLTVTATKKVLDQVGAGKMTFDEFRKEVKVDYVPAGGAGG